MSLSKPFGGGCEPFIKVDVQQQIIWLASISRDTWPNWAKGTHYPSVVTDPLWAELHEQTESLVTTVLREFPDCTDTYRAITTIHPGDYVPHHTDTLPEGWRSRIHIPLVTNPEAWFIVSGKEHHLEVGMSYQVNPSIPHAVRNAGPSSRIHLMFDVVTA
jgi:quercetin dioxygenase-like cupin family protein